MIKNRILVFISVVSLLLPALFPVSLRANTSEDQETTADVAVSTDSDDEIAERTILMYICGTDLESFSGMASHNLKQILKSNFSSSGKIRFLVMTGGASYYEWWLGKSYLAYPEGMPEAEEISTQFNQIWEAKGADAGALSSKLLLLDGDGVTGDGADAKTSEEELMSDPETLKAFINYGVSKCPAKKYDLILWDHGGGPVDGFAYDEHDPDINTMSFPQIIDAVSDNEVIRNGGSNDGKFDFINFDACLMNSAELVVGLEAYTHYYIASAETEPGYGQDYSGWLSAIGETPEMNAYALGTILVDDYIKFYESEAGEDPSEPVTLAVVNTENIMSSGFAEALTDLNEVLKSQVRTAASSGRYYYYDELASAKGSIRYGEGGYSYTDLGNLVSQLAVAKKEIGTDNSESGNVFNKLNSYADASASIQAIFSNGTSIYSRSSSGIRADAQIYMDEDYMLNYKDLSGSGMSIYFPRLSSTDDTAAYYDAMQEAADTLSNDQSQAFLRNYSSTMVDYALLFETGKAVSALIDSGISPNKITYERCKKYWQDTKEINGSLWDNNISPLMARCAGGEQNAGSWLNELALQMAADAVSEENVSGEKTISDKTEIYKVTLKDSDKRVIDKVQMNITAELPAAIKFLKDNGLYSGNARDYSKEFDFCTCSIRGKEDISGLNIDIAKDSGETILKKYQEWYNQKESQWDFEISKEQAYALKDENGVLHAVELVFDNNDRATALISYPDPYYLQYNMNVDKKAALVFEKAGEEYLLSDIYLSYANERRPVKVSDLNEAVTNVKTCYEVLIYGCIKTHVPTSDTVFTVSKETMDKIRLVPTDFDSIPDIGDTDGDGEAIHRNIVVEDIFDYEMDINDKIKDKSLQPQPTPQTQPDSQADQVAAKSGSRITLKDKTARYTGKNINIDAPKVEGSAGKVTCYYYSDPACTKKITRHKNAGTYYVKAYVAEDDKYKSAVSNTARLTIKPRHIKPSVKLSRTSYKYDGKAKKPKVTVKYGKKVLKKKKDYSLTYSSGRKKRGTYKVKIKLKGNYSGSKTKKFRIR